MKIALVIRKFTPIGGAERACAALARGLLSRGHEVHVFALEIAPLDGIVPRRVPPDGLFKHQTFAGRSRKMLESDAFDIIHSFTRTSRQDVLRLGGGIHREYLARTDPAYPALGRLWRRIRPKERFELTLEAESLAPASYRKIVAVSRRVREETIRHYRVPPQDIEVVYNAVDAADFKPNAEARGLIRNQVEAGPDDYLLLFCGTGFRRKGLDYALAALDRVPSAKLLVVGEGRARPHPRALFLGRRTDVAHLYAAADALILPTLYDPFPNVCLEAMASGIPVIVSRVAGVSEIIDGDSIVVEDPMNVDELAAAVQRLEDPAIRRPMGEAARRKALQFTPQRNLDENIKVYETVLASRRPTNAWR